MPSRLRPVPPRRRTSRSQRTSPLLAVFAAPCALLLPLLVPSPHSPSVSFAVSSFVYHTAISPHRLSSLPQPQQPHHTATIMGVASSTPFRECLDGNSDDKRVKKNAVAPATPKLSERKRRAQQKSIQHKKLFDTFQSQVLHPSYLGPVRGSSALMQASSLYPISAAAAVKKGEEGSSSGGGTLMPGTHKHLGGAYDPTDGCIYGVPANSGAVLCLYPVRTPVSSSSSNGGEGEEGEVITYKMKAIPLPSRVRLRKMKWLRGIFAHGYLWAIPAWADSVLCVDVDAYWGRRPASGDIVQLLPLPEDHPKGLTWQWHGGALNKEGTAIYCVPSNARSVLKIDLITKQTSLIPITFDPVKYPNFQLDLTNKFYGGILGQGDGCVYGMCYRSCAVLRIDCDKDKATLVGPDYGVQGYFWHGGIQVNGKIYAHPSHAPDTVLVIDTHPDTPPDRICTELPIRRAPYDTDPRRNYKWLGGSLGADGNIYCPACDTSSILKINTKTDECTTFGFAGTDKNKWQGGILSPRDECVYCIPASGQHVLRIATSPDIEGENPIQLIGDMPPHKDKWQGGHKGLDGCLYFIPENGHRVLKVTPALGPPKIVDGELPIDDVAVEMI